MNPFAAGPIKLGLDPLAWEIIPRLNIGPLSISPHGIGIAIGFLLGAQMLVARARKRGGPDENDIWNGLFWALVGAIIGARAGYVIGHWSEVTEGGEDLLGVFKVWEGGISLLGGITGGILAAVPYMRRKRIPFWSTMDLVAPALALGIFVGRIGDLMIGDHLGKPTNFFLGWRCLGESGEEPIAAAIYRRAVRQGETPSLGCFDVTVHQTALYDFLAAGLILGLLLWLGRKQRNAGFLACVFGLTYGAVRFGTDFLRVDKRYFGLTGSQITAGIVALTALAFLIFFRGAPARWRTRRDESEESEGTAAEDEVESGARDVGPEDEGFEAGDVGAVDEESETADEAAYGDEPVPDETVQDEPVTDRDVAPESHETVPKELVAGDGDVAFEADDDVHDDEGVALEDDTAGDENLAAGDPDTVAPPDGAPEDGASTAESDEQGPHRPV